MTRSSSTPTPLMWNINHYCSSPTTPIRSHFFFTPFSPLLLLFLLLPWPDPPHPLTRHSNSYHSSPSPPATISCHFAFTPLFPISSYSAFFNMEYQLLVPIFPPPPATISSYCRTPPKEQLVNLVLFPPDRALTARRTAFSLLFHLVKGTSKGVFFGGFIGNVELWMGMRGAWDTPDAG